MALEDIFILNNLLQYVDEGNWRVTEQISCNLPTTQTYINHMSPRKL